MTSTTDRRELRISFRQHDGDMVARCWCGRTWTGAQPRELWEQLDDHEHAPDPDEGGRDGS